jgi:hypothetical protein
MFPFVYTENTSVFQLLNRTPGNPLDEGKQATDHKPDTHDEKLRQNGHSQDDKRHELADVPTNEISHHSKWENILQHVSMNLLCMYYVYNVLTPVSLFMSSIKEE